MKTFILLITLMVQGDPDPVTGQRSVAVTIHSRDFLTPKECDDNRKTVLADYKSQGFRRPSVICLPRTGMEPELLNEQDNTSQAAPHAYSPSSKLKALLQGEGR